MQKRLISQNLLQCTNQSTPQFSAHGSFIAYRTDNSIKIKSFNKQISQLQLKISKQITTYFLTSYNNHLFCCIEYHQNTIQIYQLQLISSQLKNKIYQKLSQSKNLTILKNGLAYVNQNNVVKLITFENNNEITICKCSINSTIIQHQGEDIFILSPISTQQTPSKKILKIYHKTSTDYLYQQSQLNIDYITHPLGIYKDHLIFNLNQQFKQILIYNSTLSKLVGKLPYEGELVFSIIKGNLLLTILNKDNIDKYCFYTLNTDPNTKTILTHRCQYQKGKGSYFEVFSCNEQTSQKIIQGKNIKLIQNDLNINNQSVLIIYVLPIKKSKIQIIKISKQKIKSQIFKQNLIDVIVLSKIQKHDKNVNFNKIKSQSQQLSIQKQKINYLINSNKHQKSIQQTHLKYIDNLVNIKIKGLIDKFDSIQKRLTTLQNQIAHIYTKIQKSLQNINQQQIKKNISTLFERVTPQFESYFKQIFKQISSVLDQGVNYYKSKLCKQQKIHRQTFQHILHIAFNVTQQIVQLGRTELITSQKKLQNIDKLTQIKNKWKYQLQQLSQIFIPTSKSQNSINSFHNITLSQPHSHQKQKQQNSFKKIKS